MSSSINSPLFKLYSNDYVKGFVLAIIGGVITFLYSSIQSGGLNFDWNEIIKIAVISGIGYLAKNFFSNKDGQVLGVIG